MTSPETRRPICSACLRPQRACICQWIAPTANLADVLVLQHPLEVHHAKGSARLLDLSLSRSRIAVGEQFDAQELQSLISGTPANTVLLYPDTPDMPSVKADDAWLDNPSQLRLVVLDATWRKSRKMLYLNPLLHTLPRLALSELPASQYAIRKAHRPDQLSTLEAVCHALMRLEKSEEKYRPLLDAFDGFVAQQSRYFMSRRSATGM